MLYAVLVVSVLSRTLWNNPKEQPNEDSRIDLVNTKMFNITIPIAHLMHILDIGTLQLLAQKRINELAEAKKKSMVADDNSVKKINISHIR